MRKIKTCKTNIFGWLVLLVTCLEKEIKKPAYYPLYKSTPVLNTAQGFYFNYIYNVKAIHLFELVMEEDLEPGQAS